MLSLPAFAGYRRRKAESPVGEVESPTRFMRATPSGPVFQSANAPARKSGPAAAGADCACKPCGVTAIMTEHQRSRFMGRSLSVEGMICRLNIALTLALRPWIAGRLAAHDALDWRRTRPSAYSARSFAQGMVCHDRIHV